MLKQFKPLIIFANAYDCYPAIEGVNLLPADKLMINYYPYPENYYQAEKFLKDKPDYTHILYVSPDVVLDRYTYDCMVKNLIQFDYDVYGCCLNVDTDVYQDFLACTIKLPALEYINRRYRWVKEHHRQIMLKGGITQMNVKFNAGFHFIKREIKDKIPYTTLPYPTDERPIWESLGGYACDLALSHWLDFMNIPIILDLRYKVKHLRYAGPLMVGKKEPEIKFIKYEEN